MDKIKDFFDALYRIYPAIRVNKEECVYHSLMYVEGAFTCMIYVKHGAHIVGHAIRLQEEDFDTWKLDDMIQRIRYLIHEHSMGTMLKVTQDGTGFTVGKVG